MRISPVVRKSSKSFKDEAIRLSWDYQTIKIGILESSKLTNWNILAYII